mgnify:CR=1 FL=1
MAVHKIDGVDGTNHFPKKLVTLYASGACTAGYFVAITADTTNGLGGSVSNAVVGPGSTESEALTFGPVVAVALEADSTNLADVMIIDQGFF